MSIFDNIFYLQYNKYNKIDIDILFMCAYVSVLHVLLLIKC